jgi:hypothetical protein
MRPNLALTLINQIIYTDKNPLQCFRKHSGSSAELPPEARCALRTFALASRSTFTSMFADFRSEADVAAPAHVGTS